MLKVQHGKDNVLTNFLHVFSNFFFKNGDLFIFIYCSCLSLGSSNRNVRNNLYINLPFSSLMFTFFLLGTWQLNSKICFAKNCMESYKSSW